MSALEKAVGKEDEVSSNLDLFSLEMFENIAYVMAKHAAGSILDTPERGSGFPIPFMQPFRSIS